jgi:predicted phosphodiesterase
VNVLALYDIHGNLDALEAVLADERARDHDAVLVGGDAVPGAFARGTLERLAALSAPVFWIRGNGEREVSAARDEDAASDDMARLTAALTAHELGGARTWLGRLPLTLELDGVLYCHATPRRDTEMVTRISDPGRWAAALAGVRRRLVVAGHTHQQDDRRVGTVRFVNAGSVGMPYEGDGAARWLRVADGVPELCRTPYDAAAAGRRILARGWPDRESITASLIDPMDPDLITREFETAAVGRG